MPIKIHAETRKLSQVEFGEIAYNVVKCVFDIHSRFGRLFDEQIYRHEIAHRCHGVAEVPIEVTHAGFQTYLFMDLLIAQGAVFELKAADAFHARHRAQLLQYLLMAELSHGKLINLRSEAVQHEFVNTSLTHANRVAFSILDDVWDGALPGSRNLRSAVEGVLRDLGTGLDVALYEDIVTHLLGGEKCVVRELEIVNDGCRIGKQKLRLSSACTHFRITALPEDNRIRYAAHLQRFLNHTALEGIHWINVTHGNVVFSTLKRE